MTGPQRRQQLIGPINENKSEMHHCFADYILACLEKSPYQVELDDKVAALSTEERKQLWANQNPHPCRTTCPGSDTQYWHDKDQSDEEDYAISHDSVLLAVLQRPRQTRSSTRLSEASTMISPLFNALDVEGELTGVIQALPSPTLAARPLQIPMPTPRLLTMLALLSEPTEILNVEYQPAEWPRFTTFSAFENRINETRINEIDATDLDFCLSASSVSAAAQGFVNVLKGIEQDQNAILRSYKITTDDMGTRAEDNPEFYSIEPRNATLMNLFSYQVWMFKAQVNLFSLISHK